MKIRKVRPEDIESFIETYIKAYAELEDYKYEHRRDIKNYFKWLYKRDKEHFLVAEEEKIFGFIAGDTNWIDYEGKKIIEIHELFVIPEARGRGIGSSLLNEVLKKGKEKGRKKAALWVGITNLKAINFYKKHGFEEKGYMGKWLRMEKLLNY